MSAKSPPAPSLTNFALEGMVTPISVVLHLDVGSFEMYVRHPALALESKTNTSLIELHPRITEEPIGNRSEIRLLWPE